MNKNTKRWFYWLPRVLSIAFALFISIFALDVFGEGYSFWETLLALFMHLIPTFILVAVIAIAWRWERVGAALFLALALIYLSMTDGRMLTIPIPLIIFSLLFLVSWRVTLQPR
ncbi:MAG: hypothetical protein H6654_06750 [Ardenticatenaceae bacterium]|nr:hypothetical protein [Anaerolineales bacterium]MCB8942001.1 hypothetical protein [Ardenticatenaceae bacterium]MCB8973239.1 hypothetical protein [Ardenticatenaceae bacterium]